VSRGAGSGVRGDYGRGGEAEGFAPPPDPFSPLGGGVGGDVGVGLGCGCGVGLAGAVGLAGTGVRVGVALGAGVAVTIGVALGTGVIDAGGVALGGGGTVTGGVALGSAGAVAVVVTIGVGVPVVAVWVTGGVSVTVAVAPTVAVALGVTVTTGVLVSAGGSTVGTGVTVVVLLGGAAGIIGTAVGAVVGKVVTVGVCPGAAVGVAVAAAGACQAGPAEGSAEFAGDDVAATVGNVTTAVGFGMVTAAIGWVGVGSAGATVPRGAGASATIVGSLPRGVGDATGVGLFATTGACGVGVATIPGIGAVGVATGPCGAVSGVVCGVAIGGALFAGGVAVGGAPFVGCVAIGVGCAPTGVFAGVPGIGVVTPPPFDVVDDASVAEAAEAAAPTAAPTPDAPFVGGAPPVEGAPPVGVFPPAAGTSGVPSGSPVVPPCAVTTRPGLFAAAPATRLASASSVVGLVTVAGPFATGGAGRCAVVIPATPRDTALSSVPLLMNWRAATALGRFGIVIVVGANPVIPAPDGAGRLFRLNQPSRAEPPRVIVASTAAPTRGKVSGVGQARSGFATSRVGRAASTAWLKAW
jgi:hypothetical protein